MLLEVHLFTLEAITTAVVKSANFSRTERVTTLAAFMAIVLCTHAYYFNAYRATYKEHLIYYTVNYESVYFIFFCVWPGKTGVHF